MTTDVSTLTNRTDHGSAARLRAAGLRPTLSRLCVLDVLMDEPTQWMSVETIRQKLVVRNQSCGMHSVYRIVKELESYGVLVREWINGFNGSKAIYLVSQAAGLRNRRLIMSIACSHCGARVWIDDPASQQRVRQFAAHEGMADGDRPITIHVTCRTCANTPTSER